MDISSTGMMLLLMGIFHGINPGMGWLFAVGLGLQEQRRSAVWTALLPLAAGHAVAVAAAVALFAAAGAVVPAGMLKWGVAAVLFGFGVYKLFRRGHPRYGGMQVGPRELAVWSFLMASAHGAGLMVLPFISETPHAAHDHMHAMHASTHATMNVTMHAATLPGEPLAGLAATLLHTAGYLFVMGLIAVVVYEKLGLRLLRKSWINLDLIWAAALIVTAILTPLL